MIADFSLEIFYIHRYLDTRVVQATELLVSTYDMNLSIILQFRSILHANRPSEAEYIVILVVKLLL